MPSINLRDGRNRDAVVRAQSVTDYAEVAYVDQAGSKAQTRKVLKATAAMNHDRLLKQAGDAEKLAQSLLASDADIDLERIGMFLTQPARVYVNAKDEIVYRIEQTEIVRTPSGEIKERRPLRRSEPNVDGDIPISLTGKLIAKADALRRFVFARKIQIVHVNGLTYDFLFSMAKELATANSLMLLGAGKSSKEPLVFQRGATPYRGFLEGRVNGDTYLLILHLSKMELKRPAPIMVAAVVQETAAAAPIQPAAPMPQTEPEPVEPARTEPMAAAPRVPRAAEVLAAVKTSETAEATNAHQGLRETMADAKTARQRRTRGVVSGTAPVEQDVGAAPPPAKAPKAPSRARKSKPVSDQA
jgi:hypothetical protein